MKAWVKQTVTGQRILLAAKAAVAVGIAWFLGTHVPGSADKYPYYAPLGALVSMYPTFMGSIRAGLQTLIGLALGIVLAAGVLMLGSPNIVSISVAVGVGVLLAGQTRLGAGGEYVPVATLLVLIIGGRDADAFSVGYAIQMGLGVVVGLIVNVTIFPPLTLDAARLRISRGRLVLSSQLEDMAKALTEQWPPAHEDWAGRQKTLASSVSEIRGAVHGARESHKANPRAYRHSRHRRVQESLGDMEVLENLTVYVRDITEVLTGTIWPGHLDVHLESELNEPVSRCLQTLAELLKAWDERKLDAELFEDSDAALQGLTAALANTDGKAVLALNPGVAVALDVQRILVTLRHRSADSKED
ncbi:aromatic acid exporter family protein [Arthrobacter sp. GMC3]|uniref:FUSC family protein n=1 Tax=Arthrobacter sp. GMC3 TaxID=2058894 RepID=UPI0011B02721|nr:aromatic acid exporter family protein [Arthrobacter sp. GMC3]